MKRDNVFSECDRKLNEAEQQYVAECEEIFLRELKNLLIQYPEAKCPTFNSYVPNFNDGDRCVQETYLEEENGWNLENYEVTRFYDIFYVFENFFNDALNYLTKKHGENYTLRASLNENGELDLNIGSYEGRY